MLLQFYINSIKLTNEVDVYCEVAKGNATLVSSIYHYSTRMILSSILKCLEKRGATWQRSVYVQKHFFFFYFWIWMASQRANHVRHTETPPTCWSNLFVRCSQLEKLAAKTACSTCEAPLEKCKSFQELANQNKINFKGAETICFIKAVKRAGIWNKLNL